MPMDINMCGELGGEIVSKNLGGGKSVEVCRVRFGGRDPNSVISEVERKLGRKYDEYLGLSKGAHEIYAVLFRGRESKSEYAYLESWDDKDYIDIYFFDIWRDDINKIEPILANAMHIGLSYEVIRF